MDQQLTITMPFNQTTSVGFMLMAYNWEKSLLGSGQGLSNGIYNDVMIFLI